MVALVICGQRIASRGNLVAKGEGRVSLTRTRWGEVESATAAYLSARSRVVWIATRDERCGGTERRGVRTRTDALPDIDTFSFGVPYPALCV